MPFRSYLREVAETTFSGLEYARRMARYLSQVGSIRLRFDRMFKEYCLDTLLTSGRFHNGPAVREAATFALAEPSGRDTQFARTVRDKVLRGRLTEPFSGQAA